MTDPTLTRVMSGLEDVAARLEGAKAKAYERAGDLGLEPPHSFQLGYVEVLIEYAAKDLRKDIQLLRESLGGDTDGTSPG